MYKNKTAWGPFGDADFIQLLSSVTALDDEPYGNPPQFLLSHVQQFWKDRVGWRALGCACCPDARTACPSICVVTIQTSLTAAGKVYICLGCLAGSSTAHPFLSSKQCSQCSPRQGRNCVTVMLARDSKSSAKHGPGGGMFASVPRIS